MADDTAQLDEFAALVAEYLDGRASEAGIADLRRGLREDAACRDIYVAVCLQSRLMRETLPERIASHDAEAPPIAAATDDARPSAPRRWRIGAAVGIAAALAIGGAVAAVYMQPTTPIGPAAAGATVAVMLDSDDAMWLSEPIAPGASVASQAVALAGGSADFELTSGVSLTVAGPAEVTLDSGRGATLRRGMVIASVPRGAEGFTVDVPGGGRVIDLGTRFAVLVDDAGRSFVYVLEGVVEYSGPGGSGGWVVSGVSGGSGGAGGSTAAAPIRAAAGHGLMIDANGAATAAALAGVPEAMRRPLRRFELTAVRSWLATQNAQSPSAAARIERPFDGLGLTDGLTIEATFRIDDASRWNDSTNWTLLRQEHAHRVLLALQASRYIGGREGRATVAGTAPGISFGLFNGGYGELDVALDGEEGRPRFADLLDGRAHHIAAVYDAARMEKAIYLDGRLVGRETLAADATLSVPVGSLNAPVPAATIGSNNGSEPFGGDILAVSIYDGPMPQRQIEQRAERWRSGPAEYANQTGATPAVDPQENQNTP